MRNGEATMRGTIRLLVLFAASSLGTVVSSSARAELLHGTRSSEFPSHRFQLQGRSYPHGQIGVNLGLSQPILFHGFNAAIDFRWRRLVLEYSHGAALQYDAFAPLGL